jgi:excisionase family DNA binding protein
MRERVVPGLHSLRREPIVDLEQGGPAVTELDDILTTEEAAKLLKVSARTLERWRAHRRIPYVEYPRQGAWVPVRFRRADILEWLRQHVVKANRNGDQPA